MTMQHTPGPWTLLVEESRCEGVSVRFDVSSSYRVAIANGQAQEHLEEDGIHRAECEANARLIAAAPELLEALRGMVKAYEAMNGVTHDGSWHSHAVHAIAKATGQS